VFVTTLMIISVVYAQPIQKTRNISFYTGTSIPVSGLNNWYNLTPVIGFQFTLRADEVTETIFEFHYQKFNHGSIENRKFNWVVDYNDYLSKDANAYMIWNDFILKTRKNLPDRSFDLSGKKIIPSFSYGIGFYNYTQRVEGLIYPGQYSQPLDENKIMDPIIDRRVAWGGNFGLGGYTSINESINFHFALNYHMAIGYLRSFEDWGLFEVVPLQFLTFQLGIAYNY